MLHRLTDFPSMGRKGRRRLPAGSGGWRSLGRFRAYAFRSPSAGTRRHEHGDWMVTDRCLIESGDLLIPKLDVAGSTPVPGLETVDSARSCWAPEAVARDTLAVVPVVVPVRSHVRRWTASS